MLAQQFNFEYLILWAAWEKECKNIVRLEDMFFLPYAFMFQMKRYAMDLRTYLKKHRDFRKLNEILLQVVAGLQELHALGFVHRDLKPENIVLSLDRPVKVALIDFDRSLPRTCTSHSGTRGTPGYQPDNAGWMDGDTLWDLYALVAIIVECDMGTDVYQKVKEERAGKGLIKKHVEDKATCKHLAGLASSVILDFRGFDVPDLDEVAEIVKNIKFRQYK